MCDCISDTLDKFQVTTARKRRRGKAISGTYELIRAGYNRRIVGPFDKPAWMVWVIKDLLRQTI
jgi:hypothetical protein